VVEDPVAAPPDTRERYVANLLRKLSRIVFFVALANSRSFDSVQADRVKGGLKMRG
jgi:hypothetical protein